MASGLVTRIALVGAGVIHLLPLSGLVGPARLEALYGIPVDDPNLDILLRHRAVLFGILGAFILASIRRPTWQVPAITAGLVSATTFVLIAWLVGGYNDELQTVIDADIIAIVALVTAAIMRPRGPPAAVPPDDLAH